MNSIDSLIALPLLHDSATAGDGRDSDWGAWFDYFGRPDIACHAGQHFSEAGTLINAAMLGLGVALARASLAADQIASGALVCPLNLAAPSAHSYYLLGLPVEVDGPKIATFGRLLVAEAPATEASVLAIGSPAANAAAEVASSRVPVSSLSPPNRDDPADAVARLRAPRPLGQGVWCAGSVGSLRAYQWGFTHEQAPSSRRLSRLP